MPAPENRKTGGEIEITREMIEAGLTALWDSGEVELKTPSQSLLVEQILRAALNVYQG